MAQPVIIKGQLDLTGIASDATFGVTLGSNSNLYNSSTFGNGIADNASFIANIVNDTTLNASWATYDIGIFKTGKVSTIGDEIARFYAVRAFTIPSSFSGSVAGSRTIASGGSSSFTIARNGSSIGTVTFANGTSTGAFSGAGGSFSIGQRLTITANTANSNQEDISIVIKAES